jgi:hypothetical protein
MFIGEVFSIIIYVAFEHRHASATLRSIAILALLSLCDLLASAMTSIGLLYLQASLWLMLRGASLIFSALLHWLWLRRPQRPHTWAAVGIVVVAMAVEGTAAVCSTGVSVGETSPGKVALAVFLTIGSQILPAIQVVLEDYFLHDADLSPYLMVGAEGLWGVAGCVVVFLPICQAVGGAEGNGVHEDSLDTMLMLANNHTLIGLSLAFMVAVLGLNVFGMVVLEITNAVLGSIIGSTRMLCVWVVQMILGYSLRNSKYGQHHPSIGETWSMWSWMQLSGFGLLVTGMLVYRKTIRLPWITYDDDGDRDGASALSTEKLVLSSQDAE